MSVPSLWSQDPSGGGSTPVPAGGYPSHSQGHPSQLGLGYPHPEHNKPWKRYAAVGTHFHAGGLPYFGKEIRAVLVNFGKRKVDLSLRDTCKSRVCDSGWRKILIDYSGASTKWSNQRHGNTSDQVLWRETADYFTSWQPNLSNVRFERQKYTALLDIDLHWVI